ncbi:non-ribosomal peptide synthase protein (TIGR01720 family)/amino acid adenylation domain-containing protein [Nitrosospira sp. Nsp5]|uniref:Non-ribosomal peptide synthase domain TIGR01720/amino acid adenylation domain-containing protein n=1 Tax=Nitrosospira multiformis TaxID=1231 RepID=A0ABY0T875_9PROT|nr:MULTISPECIES: non-ribosomal peptide synthetase [Nitrosospira]PTR07479.1 non-ribosomal peptide synthase protein (TIGR01720 family)/amino acid adenylation domain-containing protein [Nitrosospira sp. Nsp5]SDQ40017.1 non-ribosomal peptide synthase domain TIGR01720/amino acid adenylation domain-containing protein [Nitrosospira multiformis]
MARRNTVPYSTRALEADAYDKCTGSGNDAEGTVMIEDAVESSRSANSEAFLFPTSFAQQRLWFFEQLYPGSPVYHLSTVLPFDGPLDRKALEASLGDLLDRHEALRTTFTALDGVPVQLVAPGLRIDLPLVDVSQPAAGCLERARAAARAALAVPFDLVRGPLLRASLLRLETDYHWLVLVFHHIVADGWSLEILHRDLRALYAGRVSGEPPLLPALPIQYADFACWQRRVLQGERLNSLFAYWQKQLQDAPLQLSLPTDRPRPAQSSYRGGRCGVWLDASLTARLRALGQAQGATLFMTLLAAFGALLARYSGQSDLVIGTPIANRTRSELEGLIGFFVNTLALRLDLAGDPSFAALLERVRTVAAEAYAHQDMPFEMLVARLAPARHLSQAPLFQVMFALQNVPSGEQETEAETKEAPAQADRKWDESATAKFDLLLSLVDDGRRVTGYFEYSADLFDSGTINRMAGHFEALLAAAAADPACRFSSLPILTEAERAQLLFEWNATRSEYPRESCIHELFEQHAAVCPDAIALILQDHRLTYGELNARANQVAHRLRGLGVGSETLVGICVERSFDLIIGLLGILKAGGTYLAMDPGDPPARLSAMVSDAKPAVLLTHRRFCRILPGKTVKLVCLDNAREEIGHESTDNPVSGVVADNLAYVCYTSGSTGVPKGVAVVQRAVVRLIKEAGYTTFTPDDVFLQFAPIAFDASTFEIWGCLLNGGRLVIMPPIAPSLEELADVIEQHRISTLWLTTGLFHQMVDSHCERLGGVRQLLTGGDVLSPDYIRKMRERHPQCLLIAAYGPTENTTFTSCYRVPPAEKIHIPISIGRPIANTEIYVLDDRLQPVPIGVPGELYIGGEGLARGYLHQPELTAERFIPHPFRTGARVYRTGDWVRYLPDANLEFLGRRDQQVKVRGFRVELGEVEAALRGYPGVREAVATVREDTPGDKRLAAYVVADKSPSASEWRHFLQARLPDYMVPSAFMTLPALPLTANGKIDRSALPVPTVSRKAEAVVPRTEDEQRLAEIFAQVLRLGQVGIHDNFFELGGHSLLATQAISRIRDVLHAAVPLHALFEAPTVAELALRLGPRSMLQPIPRRSHEQDSSPLSFAQQRLWFLDQLSPQSTAYNLCTTFSFTGPLNTTALEKSLAEIVRRHEILRTIFIAIDGQGTQVVMPPSPPAFTVVDLRHAPTGEARRMTNSDTATPFDLARGPLLRATLMRTGEADHVLVLTMHHIVADGWSLGILQRELEILLEANSAGQPSPLPELPIQYADFACWQRHILQGDRLDSLFVYWKKQLEDAPAQLSLPTGQPRPAAQTFHGASLSATLPSALTEGLRTLSHNEGATLFMTLLAAFGVLLSRYSGQSDLVIGTPIANRTRSELEGLIGFFVNTLALRLDLSGDPSFTALLERVRTVATGAYTHQDMPFEVLVSRLAPARHLSHTPLFQVMFALENHAEETLSPTNGRAMGDIVETRGAAKFDLTLVIAEFNDGITATLEYATDLFDSTAIRQMLGHFVVMLESVIANPEQRISELPLLSQAERQQLLVEWNDTEAIFPRDCCIHTLFEIQAARTPEAIALETVDEQLTYAQLNHRVDQLAAHLRGISADTPIGLLTDRGTGLAVGALGILKAGAAYVPIDATFPEERIAFILSDTGAPAVVTRSAFTGRLSGYRGRVICMDAATLDETGNAPAGCAAASVTPDGLAYIIYTSGSTGLPKGVMVSHRALVNHATAVSGAYELCAADRVLQIASPAFDVAAEEIFPPWLCGATVVVWPDIGPPVFSDLLDFVESRRLSILNLPASYWHGWVAELATLRLPESLRLVIAGSEPMIAARLNDWMRHTHGRIRLINAYGPSETTITAALCQIARFAVPADQTGVPASVGPVPVPSVPSVPIGRPIANTEIYVLDDRLQPVPIGVPGELYIGGEGLARGYLHQPELTAERFIPHPFRSGARVYRTGDWVRYLPDANLEFLGRRDQQVKVRGFRVELGEVEAALRGYPGVREAVATVREDTPGDKRLAAYVVADKSPSASEWRRFLQARLPDYMVPSAFMTLPALPLTANGKIDRSALPVPTVAREAKAVVPRTEDEQRLAEIFAQVLRLGQVGIHDNFFELGGDSILAIQIVARARSKGLRFTPRQLFEQPTIAGLLTVANTGSIAAEQGIVTGTAPLTPIQRWFFEQELADPQHYNQAVLLTVSRDIDDNRWIRVFDQLLAHHDALRLRFFRTGDGWIQTLADPGSATPYRRIDLSGVARSQRMAAVEEQAAQVQASLDLSRGPLLRAALFDFGPGEEASLLIAIHHLAIDGVSWRILLEDLDTANARMDPPAALPPKTTAFTSWAGKLAAHANSADLMEEAKYWLAALPMQTAPLPKDLPAPLEANTAGSSRTVVVSLSTEETARLLRDIARTHRVRIDEILLTAVALALARWSGADETLVDVEGHGRETIFDDVDLSRTVGWFTTIFPVALDIRDCVSPGAALRRIKEKLRAIPRRGIGYGLLRYMSKSEAGDRLQALPQAQMSFNYLGQFEHSVDPGDADGNDPRGPAFSDRDRRRYLIDINGGVFSDRLHLSWIYSEAIHRRATIEMLAAAFLEELRGIITYHHPSSRDMGFSPADFPLSNLDQAQLDELLRDNPDLEDIYPLSPMQEGMLFHTLLDPDSGIYVEQLLHSFANDIDIEAFEQSWRCLVMRHPALRTTFHWKGLDAPLQVVHRDAQLDCVHLDWRESSRINQRLDDFLDADRKRGFDLPKAPPMRIFLIRTGDNQFEFVWSHHHALLDGWSVPILFSELGDFYDAIQRGVRHEPPPPRPYRDYIAWLHEQDRNAAQAYWKQALQGFFAATPLVVDRPHSGTGGAGAVGEAGEHEERYIRMSTASTATLETFARTHQLTLNTLIQAAWALLLSRYSGETDIVFGVIVSGRPAAIAGVESMLGLFINALPLRVSVAEDAPLLDWLQDLQARQLKDREYEYSSLAEVQRLSEIPSGQPLFESLLVFQNYPRRGIAEESKAASATRAVERTSYPLTAIAAPGEELLLRFLYDRAHFDDAVIMRMLNHWRTLLEAITANPAARLADLSLLTAAERRQLTDWNHTRREYPRDRCIHELFLEQTARTPDAVALVHGITRFTYREISDRAHMIANHLRRLGVHPDTPVALCLERSPEMVSGVLAVLFAGGACVPLDPAYPRERLAFMLQDSGALLLLTQRALLERLPAHHALCMDESFPPLPDDPPPIVPKSMPKPENLAYIIYTSGSTGQPKGVALPHRTLVNLISWQHGELGPGGTTLQFAPLSFDVSFQELFSTLCAGATLILAPETLRQDPMGLWRLISEQQVNRLYLPFVALQQLAEAAVHVEPLPATLREIITAGEQLQVTPQIRNLFRNLPGCQLHNHYGPSETHVVTAYTLAGPPSGWPLLPPIGRPIANTCIHLFDPGQRLVPIGVPGEMYIGGDNLARGYLNRDELTAEKFVADPDCPSARLYRTGDLARYLPGGDIEFLGRLDHQVKIRGFRVEPGEVEAVLTSHPAVREAVVMAREDEPGDRRLAAYVVARMETPPAAGDLRRFLLERLPEYLVPPAYVFLGSLPLTPSGKIDRRALPAPDHSRPDLGRAPILPRTDDETRIAQIWTQVLGLDAVGVEDNFFELGGHSLLATRVISRIRDTFHMEVPLRQLFESPTVAGLVRAMGRETGEATAEPAILAGLRTDPCPLSFAQQRLWFFEQLYPGSPVYHLSTVLPFDGPLDRKALEDSLGDLLDRHEALRTTFTALDGVPVQLVAPGLRIDLPLVDVSQPAAGCLERARAAANAALAAPFDLVHGPLLRASLLRLEADYHWLVLVFHHIVADGWSLEILHRDLRALYAGRVSGEPPLPALPIQYADFACWQRRILQGERLNALFAYWQKQLQDAPVELSLPTDRPRPAQSSYRGGRCGVWLNASLTARLRALGQAQGATLFMTLLAAFGALLARYSGQSDLVIGTPIANRTRSELEGLIGFFVNTLALRIDLAGDPSFATLLERVRTVAAEAYAHQDMPFEMLVARLAPARHLSQAPLFQVMFNLLNIDGRLPGDAAQTPDAGPDAERDGDSGEPAEPEESEESAKFDLTLYAIEYDRTIRLHAVYARDLFESGTVRRILGHFTTLLEAIATHPDVPLSHLRLTHQIPSGKNGIAPATSFNEFPEQAVEQSIGSRFREQAERYPDRIAIQVKNERWTYKQLEALSNRIANAILSLRGESVERIALFFRHDASMIAAIFGILKAGKTYVPLDPAHPPARTERIIDSSGAAAVLTDIDGFSTEYAQVIRLGETERFETNPPPPVSLGAIAYILYTSGSTGEPKGVVQTHRNVLGHVRTYSNNLHLCADDRLTFVSSYSVDAAVQDIFGALLNGAAVYPISVRENGMQALVDCLVEQEITVFHCAPTLFRHLIHALSNSAPGITRLEKIRLVALGGEAVYRRDVDLFRTHFSPDCLLVNGFGLTESTLALQYFIDTGATLMRDAVPIGYPVDGVELLLLGDTGEPVDVYCPGEIVLRGPFIAMGYWRQGGIAAFPPDGGGGRLYRTGDLGRRLPDGSIEFIGRRDFQVKIRGYRIEPGEIEKQLLEYPGVKQAVVIPQEYADGQRLVAYVSARPEQAPASDGLRRHLDRRLPDYLIPAVFVVLEELPITPSGKINRLALPVPETSDDSFAPPRTIAETKLAAIWQQVLAIEHIGIHDNFFSIGGHSLFATQVISRLRDEFGVELPLQQIFEMPTIAGLALAVAAAQAESAPLPKIDPLPRWRHRATVSPLGELVFSKDLKAMLDRFAATGGTIATPF